MKGFFLFLLFALTTLAPKLLFAQEWTVDSPNGRISAILSQQDQLTLSIQLDQKNVVEIPSLFMDMGAGRMLGRSPNAEAERLDALSAEIRPQVPYKDARIIDACDQLTIFFSDDYQLLIRAYDDGVAYRFVDEKKESATVIQEELTLVFPEKTFSYFPREESMYSHNERLYLHKPVSEIKEGDFCSLPVLFDAEGVKVLFTEASLHDYPGMWGDHPLGVVEAAG